VLRVIFYFATIEDRSVTAECPRATDCLHSFAGGVVPLIYTVPQTTSQLWKAAVSTSMD